MKTSTKKQIGYAMISLGIVGLAALISYLWNDAQGEWYASLIKPSFQPPDFLFGIVWGILYVLVAIDLFLLLREGDTAKIIYPLTLTLFLGALWNYAFFEKQNLAAGVAVLALAVASCIYTTWQADRKKPLYGWLLLPWLLWQSFALVLNYTTYMIN